ncbi:unnamed protein product, partial [Amoebophrya sp. A25]|eukprot:GSA25T00011605001.1
MPVLKLRRSRVIPKAGAAAQTVVKIVSGGAMLNVNSGQERIQRRHLAQEPMLEEKRKDKKNSRTTRNEKVVVLERKAHEQGQGNMSVEAAKITTNISNNIQIGEGTRERSVTLETSIPQKIEGLHAGTDDEDDRQHVIVELENMNEASTSDTGTTIRDAGKRDEKGDIPLNADVVKRMLSSGETGAS